MRMKKHSSSFLKLAALTAAPALLCVPASGEEFENEFESIIPCPRRLSGDYEHSLGGEIFYGDGDGEILGKDTWIAGLGCRYTIRQKNTEEPLLSPEFFVLANLAYGEVTRTYDLSYDSTDLWVEQYHVMGILGANLRCRLGSALSVYVGARMGLDFMFLYAADEMDAFEESEDSDLGWIYGIGLGAELKLSDSFALTFGVDRLTTSASPKLWGEAIGQQSFTFYSLGLKYIF